MARKFSMEALVAQLNKATGSDLTVKHYNAWHEGDRGAAKFDRVVKKFMTKEIYNGLDQLARVDCGLAILLGFPAKGQLNARKLRACWRKSVKGK